MNLDLPTSRIKLRSLIKLEIKMISHDLDTTHIRYLIEELAEHVARLEL